MMHEQYQLSPYRITYHQYYSELALPYLTVERHQAEVWVCWSLVKTDSIINTTQGNVHIASLVT